MYNLVVLYVWCRVDGVAPSKVEDGVEEGSECSEPGGRNQTLNGSPRTNIKVS